MNQSTVHADAAATLTRLQATHPQLKQELARSWGFAVFPHVGRAGAVLGAAYGHGEVFEQGKSVGFATVSQITIGVQVGGQTFSEIVIFPKKETLDQFRGGKVAFTGNATTTLVKAAATGTTNFGGMTAHAYSRGGMLLELSLGGQKFMFIPPTQPTGEMKQQAGLSQQQRGDGGSQEQQQAGSSQEQQEEGASPQRDFDASQEQREAGAAQQQDEGSSQQGDGPADDPAMQMQGDPQQEDPPEGSDDPPDDPPEQEAAVESPRDEGDGKSSFGHHAMEGLKHVGEKFVGKAREVGGHLPILKKEAQINEQLHADVVATLKRMKAKDPSLAKKLDEAYGYAVYPAVGKASLVLGCAYGKGEVFRRGKLDGYAGVVQLTLGVQVGGQTYSQLVLFHDEEALKRFRAGKLGFAANISTVLIKAGAAATNNYKQGMQIFVDSEGGLALEAAIGAQKLVYRRAGLMRGKPADRDPALELGRSRPAVRHASSP